MFSWFLLSFSQHNHTVKVVCQHTQYLVTVAKVFCLFSLYFSGSTPNPGVNYVATI